MTYTYDAFTAGSNFGKGKLTGLASQNSNIVRTFDRRGNIKSDKRIIATLAHTVTYAYNSADQVTQITYPSGRLVNYIRDTTGRITQVRTKKLATDPTWTIVASSIVREPMGNLVRSLTYGNTLTETNSYTLDYELTRGLVLDGATKIVDRTLARTDNLNITAITDGITATRNVSFWHEPANRLQNADSAGQWGTKIFYYDNVGNRIEERSTPPGGSLTTDVYGYGATNNRLVQITRAGTTIRSLAYDANGNQTGDSGLGGSRTYTYNKRNRLSNALIGAISWDYTYNGLELLHNRGRRAVEQGAPALRVGSGYFADCEAQSPSRDVSPRSQLDGMRFPNPGDSIMPQYVGRTRATQARPEHRSSCRSSSQWPARC